MRGVVTSAPARDFVMERIKGSIIHGFIAPQVEGEPMTRVVMFEGCRNGQHCGLVAPDKACCGQVSVVLGYLWECGCWCHFAPAQVPARDFLTRFKFVISELVSAVFN
jgi:hypothetical protein